MRQTIVFVTLLVLLAALGVSLALGASNTRAAARALIEREAAPSPSASASAAVARSSAPAAAPTPSSSAVPEQKAPQDRSLTVTGLGWDLLAPALLAGNGLKSSAASAFASEDVRVSVTISNTMNDVERALASGGGASGGADLAVVPLSELVVAYERLRALDLRVFLVSGWSQGRDALSGVSFSKLPTTGSIALDHGGNADALALALLTLDLSGVSLERLKLDERSPSALLHAKSGVSLELDASKQEDIVLSTREAARLLPYVLIAPRPLLEERDVVLAAFVRGWLVGTDALLKDRAKAARTLAAFEGAPEALGLLHALGDIEPIRLYENAELLGLSGRGALSIESLVDWQFRARRAARVGRASTPEQSLVDGRVVTRLVRSSPKLLQAPEPSKRSAGSTATPALLEHAFQKEDEEPIISAIGLLAAVFPRHDVRLTLPSRVKLQSEWLERAAARYDLDRARLVAGSATSKPGRGALVEVLRAP